MAEKISFVKLKKKEAGKVVEISGGQAMQKKMENMGIRVGSKITKLSQQLMGGPIVARVGSTQIGMGYGMAGKIIVEVER